MRQGRNLGARLRDRRLLAALASVAVGVTVIGVSAMYTESASSAATTVTAAHGTMVIGGPVAAGTDSMDLVPGDTVSRNLTVLNDGTYSWSDVSLSLHVDPVPGKVYAQSNGPHPAQVTVTDLGTDLVSAADDVVLVDKVAVVSFTDVDVIRGRFSWAPQMLRTLKIHVELPSAQDNDYEGAGARMVWSLNATQRDSAERTSSAEPATVADLGSAPVWAAGSPSSANHTVNLDWDPSTGPVSGYALYRSATGTGGWGLVTSLPPATTSYDDSSLAEGDYHYVVVARSAAGPTSSAPAAVTVYPPGPRTMSQIFGNYHPAGCPASDNYWGSTGLGALPVGGYPIGDVRYAVDRVSAAYGTAGARTLVFSRLVYDDTHVSLFWQDPTSGCITETQAASGQGYPFYDYALGILPPSGQPDALLVRITAYSSYGYAGVTKIVFDDGSLG